MFKDFAENTDGDMLIFGGDFVVSDSDQMHIQDTIIASAGWWKQYPQDGVGIDDYVKSNGQEQVLAREIKLQLQNDGYTVDNPVISFVNEQLVVNPNAERI